MKNPLHYQLSEYDCGPTSLLNAISFLFEREEIPPEILRNIMLYCLDCYGPEGSAGKSGTSCTAMMFLSNWLQGLGDIGKLPVSSRYLRGSDVYVGDNSLLLDALHRGGAVVVQACKTGEILAMASYPTYDISTFNQDYETLKEDEMNPLFNRALTAYPPGSVYKMVTSIAAVDLGGFDFSFWLQCGVPVIAFVLGMFVLPKMGSVAK